MYPEGSTGSSPRGRGTPVVQHAVDGIIRFIPARAGNTSSRHRSATGKSVHPRAGGEHNGYQTPSKVAYGSSPRGRGTLFSQPSDSANLF